MGEKLFSRKIQRHNKNAICALSSHHSFYRSTKRWRESCRHSQGSTNPGDRNDSGVVSFEEKKGTLPENASPVKDRRLTCRTSTHLEAEVWRPEQDKSASPSRVSRLSPSTLRRLAG